MRQSTTRTCYVYGYDRTEGQEGNVVFMQKSEEGFLRLLEGCSYVIQGGGHTLMTEALHLGKPILTLPLKAMVEQRFNALYIERLGYGMQADMLHSRRNCCGRSRTTCPASGRTSPAGASAAMNWCSVWWTPSSARGACP